MKEFKSYPSGDAFKISIECGEKMLHSCIFKGVAMFEVIQNFDVGDLIDFKSVITNRNGQNDLGKIFHIRL